MDKTNKVFRSPLTMIFLAAVFLKLFLLPFFFHPDLKSISCNARFLGQGVLNIYEFSDKNPKITNICSNFPYPPLSYFSVGVLYPLINLLGGNGFTQWLQMGNTAVDVDHIFRYLFIMKLPFLIFEFLTAYLIIQLLQKEEEKRIALLVWFFNPANIYIVTMMGQIDILPAFLSILAVYLALKKQKGYLGAFFLGLSVALKSYSLFFVPFYGVIIGKNWRQRFGLIVIGLLPYIVSVAPYLKYESFRQSVLLSSLSQRMLVLAWPLGYGEEIQLVLLAIGILFLRAITSKSHPEDLILYFASVAMLFIAGSHFHPQWFIWSLPFLSIVIAKNIRLLPAFILLIIGWLGVVLMFDDKFLTLGLFSPLDPSILTLPPVRDFFSGFMDPNQIQSMFHTLFTASALWIIYTLIKDKNETR